MLDCGRTIVSLSLLSGINPPLLSPPLTLTPTQYIAKTISQYPAQQYHPALYLTAAPCNLSALNNKSSRDCPDSPDDCVGFYSLWVGSQTGFLLSKIKIVN